MSTSTTLNVRGFKLRTGSYRRFIVAVVTPEERTYQCTRWDSESKQMVPSSVTVEPGAYIHKRSDSLTTTARQHRSRYNAARRTGASIAVIIDRITGEEIR